MDLPSRDDHDTLLRQPRQRPGTKEIIPGHALPPGSRVGGLEILGLVGEGGFGIVYLAYDPNLQREVALKEYMPSALASRVGDTATVVPRSDRSVETFQAGLRSFVNEARLLARFDHPALLKVYRFWEAHGTAYMVMPYYEGPTLKQALRRLGDPPDESTLRAWLYPLLDALSVMHASQCYHRDIAPDNILITASGPLLLDFGAARQVVGDMTHALTAVLKPGYAPIEQYGDIPGMSQGPWTDVYSLACVLYYAITGHAPMPSVERLVADRLRPVSELAAGRYDDRLLHAVDAALAVRPQDRPQDMAAFRVLLDGTPDNQATVILPPAPAPARAAGPVPAPAPAAAAPAVVTLPPATPAPARPRHLLGPAAIAAAAVVAVAAAAWAAWSWRSAVPGPVPTSAPAALPAPEPDTREAARSDAPPVATPTPTSAPAPAPEQATAPAPLPAPVPAPIAAPTPVLAAPAASTADSPVPPAPASEAIAPPAASPAAAHRASEPAAPATPSPVRPGPPLASRSAEPAPGASVAVAEPAAPAPTADADPAPTAAPEAPAPVTATAPQAEAPPPSAAAPAPARRLPAAPPTPRAAVASTPPATAATAPEPTTTSASRLPERPSRPASAGAQCTEILQKGSLEPLTAEEADYLKKEC